MRKKHLLFIVLMWAMGLQNTAFSQTLVGHWTFEPANPLADLTGNFPNLRLLGINASVSSGKLSVKGTTGYATTNSISNNYSGPAITNKTLVSWAKVRDLTVRAGSILTIDRVAGDVFDGIVYAEQQVQEWMNGSNGFTRTANLTHSYAIQNTANTLEMLAITFENEGTSNVRIKIYRNCTLIGEFVKNARSDFQAGNTEVHFGIRHTTTGVTGNVDAEIEEARIYSGALTATQIAALLPIHPLSTAPTITCPSNITVNNSPGQCGASVSFTGANAATSPGSTITYSPASGSFFNKGTTVVTAMANNGCGVAQCSFTVTVIDDEAPTISCPGDISVPATSPAGAVVTYSTPTGTDICPGATTSRTGGLSSGSTFPVGVTTVTYKVTDGANLTAECSFTVTVQPFVEVNTYYSKSSGDLHNVLSWGVNTDGSGANPPDFTSGKTFNLANRGGVYTMTGDWTVGGNLVNIAGSALIINGNTLSIAEMTGSGMLYGSSASNLIVAGAAGGDQVLNFGSPGNILNTFTIDRTGASASTTLGSNLHVAGVLNLVNGTLNTSDVLTLRSTAINTARVAPITGNINGNVTVERFIPARRAWRLLAAPVDGSQSINAAWQEGVTTSSANSNPAPGFGTHITQGTAANGLDFNTAGASSSMKFYNSPTNTWNAVTNTLSRAVNSAPWFIFVRGDRGISMSYSNVPATATTLRSTGPLKTGEQQFAVSATNMTAIANPFASPINFATISRSNVANSFMLVDPKMGSTGAFVNVSWNGSSYDVTPSSHVSPNSQYIQSGQGFLVTGTGPEAEILIRESDKSATPAMDVFRQPANAGQGMRINLQKATDDEASAVLDEVFASYNANYSDKLDEFDVPKVENPFENLAMVVGNTPLMVERKPMPGSDETIQLKMWNMELGQYHFGFNPANLSAMVKSAFLVDNYLHTSTPINLEGLSDVAFTVNSDLNSQNPLRFKVIFKKNAALEAFPASDITRISVFPNPVSGHVFNLNLSNQQKGNYKVEVSDLTGKVVYTTSLSHNGGNVNKSINLNKKVSKGMYQVKVTAQDGTISTQKILIN